MLRGRRHRGKTSTNNLRNDCVVNEIRQQLIVVREGVVLREDEDIYLPYMRPETLSWYVCMYLQRNRDLRTGRTHARTRRCAKKAAHGRSCSARTHAAQQHIVYCGLGDGRGSYACLALARRMTWPADNDGLCLSIYLSILSRRWRHGMS